MKMLDFRHSDTTSATSISGWHRVFLPVLVYILLPLTLPFTSYGISQTLEAHPGYSQNLQHAFEALGMQDNVS
jgi:hypothetical protein